MEKLNTGIEILDTRLEGGFPAGSVSSLIADPKSTAELFLYDLTTTRRTHYFTTARSEKTVKENLATMRTSPEDLNVIDISDEGTNDLDVIRSSLRDVRENENIIIDTVSDIVHRTEEYGEILDEIYNISHDKNCLTYLYLIKPNEDTIDFNESKVPYISDVVMKMMSDISGEKVENRLAITKLRGEVPPPRTIKLNIGTSVEIDTSRDIA